MLQDVVLAYFLGAGKVILIATGSQRLLLISGVEEAQLNRQFTLARNNGGKCGMKPKLI